MYDPDSESSLIRHEIPQSRIEAILWYDFERDSVGWRDLPLFILHLVSPFAEHDSFCPVRLCACDRRLVYCLRRNLWSYNPLYQYYPNFLC